MTRVAFLFPGQGSQSVGMGKALYENYNEAQNVYKKAKEVLNKDIKTLCFDGPEEQLKETINTQPCIVTTSIAALEVFKSQSNVVPYYVAGHSLGEYCAMYAAGVMSIEQTLCSIQKRADLMSEVQQGTMAAVLKATPEQLNEALKEGEKLGYVDVANYNSPKQVVITGDNAAIEITTQKLMEYGGVRVIPLTVSGAFHSKYMNGVSKKFEKYLVSVELKDAKIPVITNVDAECTKKACDFREKMSKQIYSSVQWHKTMEKMWADGVDIFIEFGNGQVLTGLCKRTLPDAKTYNVYDKESLEQTIIELEKVIK